MPTGNITSASAVLTLGVRSLFVVPQPIQGWTADDIFSTNQVSSAEVVMGLDGRQSAGYVPASIPMEIALQADSDSNTFFETWFTAQNAAREAYFAFGVMAFPAVKRAYTLINGVLQGYSPFADAKRTLQPRRFSIVWESIVVLPTP